LEETICTVLLLIASFILPPSIYENTSKTELEIQKAPSDFTSREHIPKNSHRRGGNPNLTCIETIAPENEIQEPTVNPGERFRSPLNPGEQYPLSTKNYQPR